MTMARMDLSSYPKRALSKFDTLPTIEGWEVIATDTGRPVQQCLTKGAAERFATDLNRAARGGRKALAKALGSTI